MLAVDGQDRGVILLSQLQDQFSGHHKCLLISQCDGLACLDGMDGGVEACKAYHRREYHVDRSCFHDFVECLGTGIYLHIGQVAHQRFQFIVALFVGDNDGSRLELMGLLSQQFYFVVGGETVDFIQVTVLLDYLEGLGANRSSRAENGDLSFLFHCFFFHNPAAKVQIILDKAFIINLKEINMHYFYGFFRCFD